MDLLDFIFVVLWTIHIKPTHEMSETAGKDQYIPIPPMGHARIRTFLSVGVPCQNLITFF